jgi:hypothetical protein
MPLLLFGDPVPEELYRGARQVILKVCRASDLYRDRNSVEFGPCLSPPRALSSMIPELAIPVSGWEGSLNAGVRHDLP